MKGRIDVIRSDLESGNLEAAIRSLDPDTRALGYAYALVVTDHLRKMQSASRWKELLGSLGRGTATDVALRRSCKTSLQGLIDGALGAAAAKPGRD